MSGNPHIRRLQVEYQRMIDLSARSPYVTLLHTEGNPPDVYELGLKCRGITSIDPYGNPCFSSDHRLKVELPADYPRHAPIFTMLTPIWHPNIGAGGSVCIGDAGDHGFAPSMPLDDIIVRIIQIIRYQNIGLNSAFNLLAKNWAEKNLGLFPLESDQIVLEDLQIKLWDDGPIIGSDPDLEDDITIIL